ncbi:uncharacterized protein ZBIST_1059 [Zygosaccharomyces bailii]|nr:uncharacterized protein ZBIST_1059 [Zygosaccharomyces bailii]
MKRVIGKQPTSFPMVHSAHPHFSSTFREQIIIPFFRGKWNTLTTDEKQDSLSATVRRYQDAVDEFFRNAEEKLCRNFSQNSKYCQSTLIASSFSFIDIIFVQGGSSLLSF